MDEYLKALSGTQAVIIEEVGGCTYVAEAKVDTAAATDAVWRVKRIKVTETDSLKRTTVAWADGHPGYSHAANDMANLNFAEY